MNAGGQSVSLSGQYAQLDVLAVATGYDQSSQSFVVHYTDGSSTTFTQGISNWQGTADETGESAAASMSHYNTSWGSEDSETVNVYGFSFALDSSKTVSSVTLPSNSSVDVLAMTALAPVGSPTSLTATANEDGTIGLSWTASSGEDGGGSIAGYNVYRATASGGQVGAPLNSSPLSSSATSFTDSTAFAGNTYYYVVKAVSGGVSSPASNEASATAAASGSTIEVDLSSAANAQGLAANGSDYSAYGGLDGYGDALSSNALGASVSWNGIPFALGAAGVNDVVRAPTQAVPLPQNEVSQLDVLAVATGGDQELADIHRALHGRLLDHLHSRH